MPFEQLTGRIFRFRIDLHFAEIRADAGEFSVELISIRMKPREEIIDDEGGEEHVYADDGGPVFLDAAKIPLLDAAAIEVRVRAPYLFRLYTKHIVAAAAQQARPAWLEIVGRARDVVNSAMAIGVQPHADIEVGQSIKSSEPVQYVSAFGTIHTPEHDVTLGDGPDHFRVDKVFGDRNHFLPQAHARDRGRKNVHFGAFQISVLFASVQDTI